jgi:DNA-binding NarL/FixJ family response regulator
MPVQDLSTHLLPTPGEKAVLHLIAAGMSNAEIATALGLLVRTVESRVRRFSDRTGLSGRALAAWAAKHDTCCLAKSL